MLQFVVRDSVLLSLLVRRFEAVKALSVQENIPEDEISYRPDREAKVMRNAIEQNNGMLPVGSLSKIMREIISIEQQIHRAFNVAVYVKEQSQNMLELSKEHTSATTAATTARSGTASARPAAHGIR